MSWEVVDPMTLVVGEQVRATKGELCVYARVTGCNSTTVILDLDSAGIPFYLDEGWVWEAHRPVVNGRLPGVAYDTDGCPAGIDWLAVVTDMFTPPYEVTDPKHPAYVDNLQERLDSR